MQADRLIYLSALHRCIAALAEENLELVPQLGPKFFLGFPQLPRWADRWAVWAMCGMGICAPANRPLTSFVPFHSVRTVTWLITGVCCDFSLASLFSEAAVYRFQRGGNWDVKCVTVKLDFWPEDGTTSVLGH
jgi:hypothetical protein